MKRTGWLASRFGRGSCTCLPGFPAPYRCSSLVPNVRDTQGSPVRPLHRGTSRKPAEATSTRSDDVRQST